MDWSALRLPTDNADAGLKATDVPLTTSPFDSAAAAPPVRGYRYAVMV